VLVGAQVLAALGGSGAAADALLALEITGSDSLAGCRWRCWSLARSATAIPVSALSSRVGRRAGLTAALAAPAERGRAIGRVVLAATVGGPPGRTCSLPPPPPPRPSASPGWPGLHLFVWMSRTGFPEVLAAANGGAGSYKWQRDHLDATTRDQRFAAAWRHYCGRGQAYSLAGEVACR
jgi:hypothetical protein